MDVSLHDVHQALLKLGKLRFGEMSVEDAIREVVQTTHAMFDVDGALVGGAFQKDVRHDSLSRDHGGNT